MTDGSPRVPDRKRFLQLRIYLSLDFKNQWARLIREGIAADLLRENGFEVYNGMVVDRTGDLIRMLPVIQEARRFVESVLQDKEV